MARWPWYSSAWGRSLCILPVVPCHSSTITCRAQAGFTCPMQAELLVLLHHSPLQPRLGKHREEKAGQKREHFQKKGGQPAPAICHRALGGDKDSPEHCRRGRPCCHHPEVQQHTCTSNPCRLPHLPPQRPPRHRDSRAEQQLPLAVNSHSCTGAATGDRPQPHVAVSENISGARRAAVPPAPCQAAVHRGPCLPGPTTTPLATQSLYLRAPLISF